VRRAIRALAVAALTVLLAWPATAAGAVPLPPNTSASGEWWFVSWDIAKIWNMGAQGQGVTVAVLDSGVNPAVAGLSSALGDGIDMTVGSGSGDGRTDRDQTGHGTRMAAFIAGQTQAVGIAPRARILPVVVNTTTPTDNPDVYSRAIAWSVDHGAKVINLSQGTPGIAYPDNCPPNLQQAIKAATDRGAVIVAATGNDATTGNPAYYPAACKGVLAVGAIDLNGRAWSRSEQQPYADMAAPGVAMHTVDGTGKRVISEGTSDASALTAGAVALVWSKYPNLTNRQVVARILATLRDDSTRPGHDDVAGGGIVRPYRAIVDRIPASAPNPIFDELGALPGGPTGGAPSGAGTTPPCVDPPKPGQAQATVGPPPSGVSLPPAPPPCVQATASSGNGSGGSGFPLGIALIAVAVVLLVGVLVAVRSARRPRAPVGSPPQAWPPQGPPQQGPPPQGPPPQGPPPQGPNQGWPPR
jgi:subtilisin family serine protease